jgi:hypothetical protein
VREEKYDIALWCSGCNCFMIERNGDSVTKGPVRKHALPTVCVNGSSGVALHARTHTRAHTHTYIYIYICIFEKVIQNSDHKSDAFSWFTSGLLSKL